jgi:hypothetical protein
VFELSAMLGAMFSLKITSRRIGGKMRRILSRAVMNPFSPVAFRECNSCGILEDVVPRVGLAVFQKMSAEEAVDLGREGK